MGFRVWFATGPDRFTDKLDQQREAVGYVEANSLEHAFMQTQNIGRNWWNEDKPLRSSFIGDVFETEEGFFMIDRTGFILLDTMSKNESEQSSFETLN